MAKRKAARQGRGTPAADAKAPKDSVYIGQSVKPEYHSIFGSPTAMG